MFNVISLKAIKDPCVMHAAFLHGATLQVFDGFSWVSKPEPHCLFLKRWRSNPLHHHIPNVWESYAKYLRFAYAKNLKLKCEKLWNFIRNKAKLTWEKLLKLIWNNAKLICEKFWELIIWNCAKLIWETHLKKILENRENHEESCYTHMRKRVTKSRFSYANIMYNAW